MDEIKRLNFMTKLTGQDVSEIISKMATLMLEIKDIHKITEREATLALIYSSSHLLAIQGFSEEHVSSILIDFMANYKECKKNINNNPLLDKQEGD